MLFLLQITQVIPITIKKTPIVMIGETAGNRFCIKYCRSSISKPVVCI